MPPQPVLASQPARLPKKWPHVIRNGDVAVKIYENNGNVRGEKFQSFVLSYYANGKRQLRRFVEFAKANAEAMRIAEQKAQGALGAAALSAADRVALEQALALLAKVDGLASARASRLVEIIRDYASARSLVPKEITLTEIAQFYKQRHPANIPRKSVAEVVAEFIADRLSAGCSAVHIGLVAFSEAQQNEIESALTRLAEQDAEFSTRLENEYVREDNDVFCGLFVKNLENVQGDERDIIIMSVCYGHDLNGRMLMNFGPINQRGGEKRLNVIFSRAKHHMAIVSSIRHYAITNDYNDGANSLKNFLQYAEAISKGDEATARRVLENLNPLSRKVLAPLTKSDSVVESLASALRQRGHLVDLNVGQSKFRCDLAVRGATDSHYQLGILVDTDGHYANPNLLDRYLMQPGILKAFGWRFALVLTKDWYHNPEDVLKRLEKILLGQTVETEIDDDETEEILSPTPTQTVPAPDTSSVAISPQASDPQLEPTEVLSSPAPMVAGSVRYFEFVGGTSKKFWEITLAGTSFTVRYGRIGTAGQSQSKSFTDEARAKLESENLIAEKVKKGYVEKHG